MFLAARDFKARDAYAFILPGVLLVGASWFYLPIVNAGYGLIYAGVIILAFNVASFRHFLSRPIMVWFGERSYSIFLVHFSVFYLVDNLAALFTSERNIWYGVLSRGAGIPIAIFAGMLLFHFVERRQARGLVTGHIFWPWQVKRLWPDA